MPNFPATLPTAQPDATSLLNNNFIANGGTNLTPFDRLTNLEQIVGNLLTDPATQGGTPGGALSVATLRKRVSAIADNVATLVLTITVPNVLASGVVRVRIVGIAGASGAIGAGEDVTAVSYDISFARTVGVAVGATASTAYGSAAAVVVGAGTMTTVAAITLTGEGVGATNTIQVKATIDQSSTSTLHTCMVLAECFNNLAGGATIS